jgi:hypothetical protein
VRITYCGKAGVPGADGCDRIVYVPVATALWDRPVATAIALIVVVALTGIGTVYGVEAAVGVVPSIV